MTTPDYELTRRLHKDPLAHLIATYLDDCLALAAGDPTNVPGWTATTSLGLANAVRYAAGVRPTPISPTPPELTEAEFSQFKEHWDCAHTESGAST